MAPERPPRVFWPSENLLNQRWQTSHRLGICESCPHYRVVKTDQGRVSLAEIRELDIRVSARVSTYIEMWFETAEDEPVQVSFGVYYVESVHDFYLPVTRPRSLPPSRARFTSRSTNPRSLTHSLRSIRLILSARDRFPGVPGRSTMVVGESRGLEKLAPRLRSDSIPFSHSISIRFRAAMCSAVVDTFRTRENIAVEKNDAEEDAGKGGSGMSWSGSWGGIAIVVVGDRCLG